MAYNPFLAMGETPVSVSSEVLNPFMISNEEETTLIGDNPFSAGNPFSDFSTSYEPQAADTVPIDIFGTSELPSMGAKQFDEIGLNTNNTINIFSSSAIENERLIKPTDLDLVSTTSDHSYMNIDTVSGSQPPSRPLPPETQNLILSVTGQMEFTSSDLLDRIPLTRTPSPVSMRDIHTPSPTPDVQLLDESVSVDTFDINRNKPARPPPARPPPVSRPPPPRPAPPPQPKPPRPTSTPQAAPISEFVSEAVVEEINLFDAPAPVTVKPTKEAILSLYSTPKKEERPIDFLSDDIIEDFPNARNEGQISLMNTTSNNVFLNTVEKGSAGDYFDDVQVNKNNDTENLELKFSPSLEQESVDTMDCSEPPKDLSNLILENEELQNLELKETDRNPFENLESKSKISQFDMDIQKNNLETNPDANLFNTISNGNFNPFPEVSDNINMNIFGEVQSEEFMTSSINEENEKNNVFESTSNLFSNDDGDTFNENNQENALVTNEVDVGWGGSSGVITQDAFPQSQDAFDVFSAKFDSAPENHTNSGAWGDEGNADVAPSGFEAEAFDPFLSMGAPPPPAATPRLDHQGSHDSADDTFSLFIKPKEIDTSGEEMSVPALAPPPRPQVLPESPRANPFDKSGIELQMQPQYPSQMEEVPRRSGSGSGGETPPTPLFDDDVSVPLEDFPRIKYDGPGWEMHLRQPNKKKITGQRFWKKIFVRMTYQGDSPVVQLLNTPNDKEPFQELPLQACYSVSEAGAQQFDQFGKIFTVKLQYIFYKERPGVRPGQVTKAERITNKLSQFAAYAIQGDYQGVKEFGSDLRKLGLPVEHAPQVSQLFKLGSLTYEDIKQFSCCIEEALFRLSAHRDRALTYKMEEVQITAVDELYVEQDAEGSVMKQIARVRLFFLGFLSGMPDVELGVNDLRRQGKEVVGRHDIIPVVTEEWIRVEHPEFHACVQPEEFDNTQIIKFKPPDACYIELMRFRVRPPKNRELPLQLKAVWCVTGNKVELRADVLVPGFASRKLGQVPCEDVAIRFPIPECWIYLFRVEKHFRYGSVKSAHRRTGKIKGIERFLGAVDTLQESLIEVTSGQAKYEHQHRAIVWRMPRLPKEGQGAYTTHNLVCRMALTSFDQVPEELARWAYVEFTMPATQVSHMTVRSVSLQNYDNDPPEKYVRYLARHEYTVGIERVAGAGPGAYAAAASVERAPPAPTPAPAAAPAPAPPAAPSSDSDSD